MSNSNNSILRSSKRQFLNSSTSPQNLSFIKHAEFTLCVTDSIPLNPFHKEERLALHWDNFWKSKRDWLLILIGYTSLETNFSYQLGFQNCTNSVHVFHAKFHFLLILTANVLMSDNFLSPSLSPLNLNYRLHSKRWIFVHGSELKCWPSVDIFFP